ncbi:MAG: hypothetical protein V7739_04230 [Motiliproteus sp.]
MKSWTQPTNEMIDKVLSSVKKETDRQYFFSRLNNPLWIGPLERRGYFSNPPGVKQLSDGYVQHPHWPELAFLVTVAGDAAGHITEILLALPKTDNPRVYEDILTIALKLKGQDSVRLLPKIVEYTELEHQFLAHRYPELIQHWAIQGNIDEALEIVKKLIPFQEDPRTLEKQQLRKKEASAPRTLLEPSPRFDQWEYEQLLEEGVRPLAESDPYRVSCVLIDAVASMIRMKTHPEELDRQRDEDYSEIWCRRLDKSDRDYQDAKEALVHTLTYACEQVYNKAPESAGALDRVLRNQHWKVFKRLRQYLYSLHPNDQTLPWIREFILGHDDYSKREHHYEFQLMIRKASEQFGHHILSNGECSEIFDAIINGPSQEDFREWMGERYSDEGFQQRQHYFHRMQLRPFSALLDGKYRDYFDQLVSEAQAEDVSDDSYSPYSSGRSGAVSYRSPKSAEDLESFMDEELLIYLNDWNDEHRDQDNWLVEINISALAGVFQSLFKERIISDEKRLAFWMAQRDRIERPIYVVSMLNAMQELIKEGDFDRLGIWSEFCGWVLSHPDSARIEDQSELGVESSEHPDWGNSRRAVVDFIDASLSKDTDTPITARDSISNLLQQVCSQFDWRLDHSRPVLPSHDDPITEAINNTRSRALESLVYFGFWIRRYLPEDTVPEVTSILSNRMGRDAEVPLTRPEYALLGRQFGNLCVLNRDWCIDQLGTLFPKDNVPVWQDVFGSYIRFNRPAKVVFEILQGEFEYLLERLDDQTIEKAEDRELVDMLGQHLFTYYLWEVFPLTGEESLLARFYDKTRNDREHWAQLFDHAGRSLRNSGNHLDKALVDRAIAYFDWRFETAEPLELQKFTFWLEAECLDSEWRLRSYAMILDYGREKNAGLSLEMRALNKMFPDHLSLVIECFAKITGTMDQDTQMYLSADEAKPILRAGLNAEEAQTREAAERAREDLLRLGRFDYLDMQ